MTSLFKQKTQLLFIWGYALTLAASLYFAKALTTVHSPLYLVAWLAGGGLALGLGLSTLGEKGFPVFLLFQILQGGLAFVAAKYLFDLPLLESLAYPAGAALAPVVLGVVSWGGPGIFPALITGGFLAGGLAVALRLGGISGGLALSLAFFNSYYLGNKVLPADPNPRGLWQRAVFLLALLAVGRAVVQYYLVESHYANLGVVITHPYTYVALFAGILLPFLGLSLSKEDILSPVVWIPLLGILLPLTMGIFVHVRPMAGFLLALVTGGFLAGLIYESELQMGIFQTLAMFTTALSLPLFKTLGNLSRWVRLEILGGILIVAVLIYLGVQGSRSSRVRIQE